MEGNAIPKASLGDYTFETPLSLSQFYSIAKVFQTKI